MSRMKLIVGFSGTVVLLFATLTGCTFACTAIGHLYSVEVHITGEFATLEACADGDCVSSADATSANSLMFTVRPDGDGSWTVGSFTSTPDRLTLRALDDAGALLAEDGYDLEWTRTGGSERCGGPMSTTPVDFAV
ncbi:hypothetical protein ABIE21_002141 [Conyzicola nivalis]|uniref:Uncharacterized protein n=1 Tax=Conyzicola nivalis TaxID=1477021 RepID=A0ABV2QNK5_9MICO